MLFKSPLGCIHQSVRELCTTPDKIIKPRFCAGLQFVLRLTRSKKNRHAVVTRWPYAMYQTDLMSYNVCTSLAILPNKFTELCSAAAIVPNKFTELCSSVVISPIKFTEWCTCSSAAIVPNNFKIITQ